MSKVLRVASEEVSRLSCRCKVSVRQQQHTAIGTLTNCVLCVCALHSISVAAHLPLNGLQTFAIAAAATETDKRRMV